MLVATLDADAAAAAALSVPMLSISIEFFSREKCVAGFSSFALEANPYRSANAAAAGFSTPDNNR